MRYVPTQQHGDIVLRPTIWPIYSQEISHMTLSTHLNNGNVVQNGFPHHHSGQHGSNLTSCISTLQMKSSKRCKKPLPLVTNGILSFTDFSRFNTLTKLLSVTVTPLSSVADNSSTVGDDEQDRLQFFINHRT